ncbi:uncharacterized protein G2W53_017090 [Senna tora]|uniref:Uncharacterized protein n=1 Tax=Senna tora TaxID=362788 RepID=A0A834TS41_9FABA|nr:uncharacterized protein G2W53_017090 [Senna tora]
MAIDIDEVVLSLTSGSDDQPH